MPKQLTQQERLARDMLEKDLQKYIMDLARVLKWTVFHVNDSRRQQVEGLPDLLLVRGSQCVWWELKRETKKYARMSLVQEDVIEQLRTAGQTVRVVKPSDYLEDRVAEWLR
jgi:enamine deaminase RidA (YjgF/YER057c/UK114 family)|tara:strand:- start:26994 stop:27329 length:336 start_codon:yes stop_codon:yes gene_type:complete